MRGKAAESFEELHVYQRARELANAVYALTRLDALAKDRRLADQIRRAAVSVMSNIAEGFERGTTAEFVQFLYIAKGSCGEVRAQLELACDQNYISRSEHERLVDQARRVSGMISNLIAHIQGLNYRGEKHARPRRIALSEFERRREELRTAQERNMRPWHFKRGQCPNSESATDTDEMQEPHP